MLVAARAVQGLGGTVVSALAFSLIVVLFTQPAERPLELVRRYGPAPRRMRSRPHRGPGSRRRPCGHVQTTKEETVTGGTIVCGVPEAAEGCPAADLAGALSARLGLRLVLVSVLDGVPPGARESLTGRQRQSGAERTLTALANELADGAETRVVHGRRADALAQVAAEEGADVIVVGSRPTGLGGRKLRSTLSRELEAVTPVPVLVAPPSTRKRSDRRLAVAAEAVGR